MTGAVFPDFSIVLLSSRPDEHVLQSKVHGFVTGYPCTSISQQNNSQKSFLDKDSKTGAGYDSLVTFVRKRPGILFILLENVKGMLHARKQFNSEIPMEIQSEQLKQLGFERVFSLLLNSSEFGLAQSRARSWSLFVRSTNVRQDTVFINILTQLIKDF